MAVEKRAKNRCEYCHAPQAATGYRFHLDHVKPASQRGSNSAANRALSCASCNLAKSNRTRVKDPLSLKIVRLFNPRKDDWGEHFRWAADTITLLGRTPIGRAAVASLEMNTPLRLTARVYWVRLGLLP